LGPSGRDLALQFAGATFFFDRLDRAKDFYTAGLGLEIDDEDAGDFVAFRVGAAGFLCLNRRESATEKAMLSFGVGDVQAVVEAIGAERFAERQARSAALEDPEGHTISLAEHDPHSQRD